MKLFLSFIIGLGFIGNCFANDSLKVKKPKCIIDLSYGSKYFNSKIISRMDYDSRYVVQLEQDNLFSLNSSFTLFAAKEKSGVNIFSIGTGFNVTTTILNIWMIHQYPYPLGVGEDKIVKKLTSYNIPLYMTYTFIGERNGCFSTKIGAYIPVNNEKALNLPLKAESKSAVSPFFNLGFGFKIKRFIPFLSVEAIYYRSKVQGDYWSVGNSLFLRTQLGLAFVL